MNISATMINNVLTIKILCEIESNSIGNLCTEADKLIMEHKAPLLELDISQVKYMGSSGFIFILDRYKKQRELGGKFKLLNPTKQAMKLLQLAGVDKIVEISQEVTE